MIDFAIIESCIFILALLYGHCAVIAGEDFRALLRLHCQNPGHRRLLSINLTLVVKGIAPAVPALTQIDSQSIVPGCQHVGHIVGLGLKQMMIVSISGSKHNISHLLTVYFRLVNP